MLLRRTLQFLLLPGLVLQASGCKEESSHDLLEQQRERWRAKRPERYVVETCSTPWHDECQRVAVDGDTVVAARLSSFESSGEVIGDVSELEEPIGRLFDAAGERDPQCILKQLEFDAKYGFVGEYMYQCRGSKDHGEKVVCFIEEADSLEACDNVTS